MRIDERIHGNALIIEPKGRLTVETEAHFTETIRRLIAAGRTRLVLDLAEVPSIDCRGLGAIAHAYVAVRDCGGELKLLNLTPRVRQLLTVTRLLTVLSAYSSEAEAERSFSVNRRPIAHTTSEGPHSTSPHRIDLLRAT
jgi:anti-sigma B factor antagonist